MLKTEQSLPAEFCLEVFISYLMYDEALLFLFYRQEYSQLLSLIRQQIAKETVEISKQAAKKDDEAAKAEADRHQSLKKYWIGKY